MHAVAGGLTVQPVNFQAQRAGLDTVELKIRNGVRKAVCRVWVWLARLASGTLAPKIFPISVALAFVTHKEEELVLDDAPPRSRQIVARKPAAEAAAAG